MRPGLSEDSGAPLQSPIHWAVLGLIIERPSYGYELGQRFERAFGRALHLSSASYIYKAIEVLEDRGLIEAIAGRGGGRQPKLRYRATPAGVDAFKAQLISEASEDRRRSRLFARKLAAFVREPEVALGLIAAYRDACLKEAVRPSRPLSVESELDPAARLAARLEDEETRVIIDAKLSWLDYATSELEALLVARVPKP
jgi:DNA-binding PadR family transcriptional regulator